MLPLVPHLIKPGYEAAQDIISDARAYVAEIRDKKRKINEAISVIKAVLPWVIGGLIAVWFLRD